MNRSSIPEPHTRSASCWGLLAGVVGSLCCLGPSAAVLLGFGSSSALFGLQFDQSWSLATSGVVLAGGALLALKRSRSTAVCGLHPWRQPLIMLLVFVVSYLALGVGVPRLAAQQEHAAAAALTASREVQPIVESAPAQTPQLRRLTVIIEKMTCPPCAAKIRNRLAGKPAVRELRAEDYNEEVIVTYDATQTSGEALVKLLPRQYGITVISDELLP